MLKVLWDKRHFFAGVTAFFLWGGWLVSLLWGGGTRDAFGKPAGADFVSYVAAGRTVLDGKPERLYDREFQKSLQRELTNLEIKDAWDYNRPPVCSLAFVPFALFPYKWAFLVWALAGVLFFWLFFRALKLQEAGPLIWAWFPVFATVSYGQTAFYSLGVVTISFLLWRHRRRFASGFFLSFALDKPHLILGILFFWFVRPWTSRRAWMGFFAGALFLASVSFIVFPDASLEYYTMAVNYFPQAIHRAGFPVEKLFSLNAITRNALPGVAAADALAYALQFACAVAFLSVSRRRNLRTTDLFALSVALSLVAAPYLMPYDLVLLLIPLGWLGRYLHGISSWRKIRLWIWAAPLLHVPLTMAQHRFFGRAVALFPAVALVCYFVLIRLIRAVDSFAAESEDSKPPQKGFKP